MNGKVKSRLVRSVLLALLGALMFVSQVIMAPLPNIEIVSLLIILTTVKFGIWSLASVYIFAFCEIFTYGLGIWTVNYLYVWAVLCVVILFLRKVDNAFIFALVSAFFGLLFGTLCSAPYFLTGGVAAGIAYIFQGIWFDIIHCVSNFALCLVLYKPLKKVFDKM